MPFVTRKVHRVDEKDGEGSHRMKIVRSSRNFVSEFMLDARQLILDKSPGNSYNSKWLRMSIQYCLLWQSLAAHEDLIRD